MLEAFQRLSLTSSQFYTQMSTSQFSPKLIECSGFKRLDSLTITNFKSFKGKVYVGPLLDFTSIVGPNGAGKSNVLDALMFCFSNQKSKLTVSDIREFINREGLQTYSEMNKKNKYCQVQARFILQNGSPFALARILYPDQRQLFIIDGDQYPQKVYENFLIKCNINYITSNFAIWQGEIDKLLLKNPKELTNYIENISGSVFFKKEYEDLKNQITQIDSYLQSRSLKLAKLKQSKKTLKNITNQKNSFLKIQSEYEQILKKIVVLKSYMSQVEIKQFENSIKSREKEQGQRIRQINENKIKLQREHTQKIQLQSKMNRLIKEIAQSASQLKSVQQFTNVIDLQTISQLKKTLENLKNYLQSLNIRKHELEKEMSQMQSNDINKQYLQLYGRWQRQNQLINKQLSKRKEEYLYVLGILQSKKNIIQDYNLKQMNASEMSKQQLKQKEEIQNSIQQLEKAISRMNVEHSKMTQELSKNKSKREDLMDKIVRKNEEIIQLESLFTQNVENQKDKALVLKLNQIQGFQGAIEQRVIPSNKKYQVCFQLMMGPILKYLLCLNESSSKQVAVKLRQNYQMKNMVILKNVQERKQLISRSILGKLGLPAIEAIQYDKNIANFQLFLKQYLNGKIICDTMQNAWSLLSQNIKGVKQIYTLDGNVLRNDGVVTSYGAIDTTKHKYRYVDVAKNTSAIGKDIEILKKEKAKLEEQLETTKKKTNQNALANHRLEIQKIQSKKQELKMRLQALTKSIDSKRDIKAPKGLQKQIQQLQKRSKKLQENMNEIEKQMLKSKIFSEFIKKNNISIENFRSVQDLSSLEDGIRLKNKSNKQLQELQRQVTKIGDQIAQKESKLQNLADKVSSVKGFNQKQSLEQNLKRKQAELIVTRTQLAKMSNINIEALKFKSEVPQMIAKLEVMKERKAKMIKSQLENVGLTIQPSSAEYSKLQEHLGFKLERASKDRVQNAYQDLQKEKNQLQSEIEKNNISISDVRTQYENQQALQQQMQRLANDLKEHSDRKNELQVKLQQVKGERKSVFMNFMDTMKPILQNAYQMLTQKEGIAGKAQIYLENQQFPCDYGIYYTPVPPAKRFIYDLDQLSGGQKSIASLALQYAITLTSKSPFLILDETDAFLDSQNVNRFKNLIRHTLQRQRKLQLILITHKRSLFLAGKSLVGVTKFKDDPFSKAFSLRLKDSNGNQYEYQPKAQS